MTTGKSAILLLFGSIAVVGLTGCEQIERAASDAAEKAGQSAVRALDEVAQTGSLDGSGQSAAQDARQSADQLLLDARQKAAGLLGRASEYLSAEPAQETGLQPGEDPAAD